MDHINLLREEFIEVFSNRLLTPRYIQYNNLVEILLDSGIITDTSSDGTYGNYLIRALREVHLDYINNRICNRIPKEILSSKVYDLYGPDTIDFVYDKYWSKVQPNDLVVTGSLNISKFIRRSNNNKANCLLRSMISHRNQYVLRNSFVKVSTPTFS